MNRYDDVYKQQTVEQNNQTVTNFIDCSPGNFTCIYPFLAHLLRQYSKDNAVEPFDSYLRLMAQILIITHYMSPCD